MQTERYTVVDILTHRQLNIHIGRDTGRHKRTKTDTQCIASQIYAHGDVVS